MKKSKRELRIKLNTCQRRPKRKISKMRLLKQSTPKSLRLRNLNQRTKEQNFKEFEKRALKSIKSDFYIS